MKIEYLVIRAGKEVSNIYEREKHKQTRDEKEAMTYKRIINFVLTYPQLLYISIKTIIIE